MNDDPARAAQRVQRHAEPQKSVASQSDPFHHSVEEIETMLWIDATDDMRVYAILDGDWAEGLYGRLVNTPDLSWVHMFQGRSALANVQNSPFVVALKRGHKFNQWLIGEGWGQGWGIYFVASTRTATSWYGKPDVRDPLFLPSNQEQIQLGNLSEGLEDPIWMMRRHFRRFSDAEMEDESKIVTFRYYDPATLRTYLPTCNERELIRFFGPVTRFLAEGFSAAGSRSQDLYFYSLPRGDDGKRILRSRCYDMQTLSTRVLDPHPAAEKPAQREAGPYLLIRRAQNEAFQEQVLRELATETAGYLIKKWERRISAPKEGLVEFVLKQFSVAEACHYSLEIDLVNFAICAFLIGDGFHEERPFSDHLSQVVSSPRQDDVLERWAEEYDQKAKLRLVK